MKVHKPRATPSEALTRLDDARAQGRLVRITRWLPDGADQLDGFVAATSAHWVALSKLSDRVTPDGWALVRVADLRHVGVDPNPDAFEIRALKARGLWPTPPLPFELSDTAATITAAAGAFPLISLFRELDRPTVCWVGVPTRVEPGRVEFTEVTTDAQWIPKARHFDTADITRIDVGGGYEDALALVAGPRPGAEPNRG